MVSSSSPEPVEGPAPPAKSAVDERTVFGALFAAYPDALIVADTGGAIVMANPSAAALLGYTIGELCGLHIDALVPDAIRPRHAAYRNDYAHHPRPRAMGTQMDLVARRRDGSEVMVEIGLSPLQSHGLPFVVAAIRDIGSYPRMKQALQRARYSDHLAKLGRLAVDARNPQELLEQVPVIAAEALQVEVCTVFLLEPNRLEFRVAAGVGLVADEAAGQRLPNRPDCAPGFVLEQATPVIVPDYPSERRFAVPQSYLDAGLVSGLGVPLSDRGRMIGALTVCACKAGRFGDDEVGFLESLSNLLATSLQRAESEEALSHAQRLESVGQLTGGIAHDFNNLLTVIQGNLQVLEELPALAGDARGQHLVSAAARATKRGAELTSKLLAFSRRQLLRPSSVDVSLLLHSLADMLRRTLDQRVGIEVDVPAGCPAVLADPGQLEAALLNIAINARDAMPEGGSLHFRATVCEILPPEVRHEFDPAVKQAGFVAIAISDTGSGMSDEVKERAFEPFFTTKEAGRGTGMGLSTVYGFVKQSRGVIAIDSHPGVGTTLTLYLPGHLDASVPPVESAAASHVVPRGLEVLLVEDDAEVRAVAATFLETIHCRVTQAASAEQALSALGSLATGETFDLLLTDIALGAGMRGTQLAAQAQERLPEMAVLLMSGYSSELLDADRDSPAAWELLRKPFSREELALAIARLVRSQPAGY